MAKNKNLDVCQKRELFCECEQCVKYWAEFDSLIENLELDIPDDVKAIQKKYRSKTSSTVEDFDDEHLAELAQHYSLDGWGT